MKNITSNNIDILSKKINHSLQKHNRSSLETNRTNSSGIKSSENSYGRKFYKKLINKILYKKYNTSPKDHDMILLENVLQSKYCHDLAVFKEKILFNYNEEFLRRYYNKEESILRIPKFVMYYKNYLIFFCNPIFSELNLNDLLQVYSEKKAQIFYNNNYKDDITNENEKKVNFFTLFTPKIRKLISNNNSLSNLSINNFNPNSNNVSLSSMENSMIKLIHDLSFKKNNVKKNKKLQKKSFPLKKDNKNIKENQNNNIMKSNLNNQSPINSIIKSNGLGKNLFFIYNQNFKKILSNHSHTKTGTNLNLFKEKVFSERANSKKKSNSKISFSKQKVKRSRNLIISNPLFTDLGIYSYRNEKTISKKKLNKTNYHTINYSNFSDKKKNLKCITERNKKNLIKVIKQVESNENKKFKNNYSRNTNRNSFHYIKGNLNLNIFSSAFLKGKSDYNNFNDIFLKTDYHNEKNNKIKTNLNDNLKIKNKGFSEIKKYVQTQKKKLKK